MAAGGTFEIAVHISADTAAHLLERYQPPLSRMAFVLANHERVTDNHAGDIYLPAFFATYPAADGTPTENIPACQSGRPPRRRDAVLDAAILDDKGAIDIFGYARSFIEEHYYTKSRRCRDCVHDLECEGVHINFVRAHGYGPLLPILDEADDQRGSAVAAG